MFILHLLGVSFTKYLVSKFELFAFTRESSFKNVLWILEI